MWSVLRWRGRLSGNHGKSQIIGDLFNKGFVLQILPGYRVVVEMQDGQGNAGRFLPNEHPEEEDRVAPSGKPNCPLVKEASVLSGGDEVVSEQKGPDRSVKRGEWFR